MRKPPRRHGATFADRNRQAWRAFVVSEGVGVPIIIVIELTNQTLLAQICRFDAALFGALCVWFTLILVLGRLLHIPDFDWRPDSGARWSERMRLAGAPLLILLFGGGLLWMVWTQPLATFLHWRLIPVAYFTPALVLGAGYGFYTTGRAVIGALRNRLAPPEKPPTDSDDNDAIYAEVRRRKLRRK